MYAPDAGPCIDSSDTRFSVAGPHLLPRSPQVEPLIVQAGASDVGRDFVARNADLWLFGAPSPAVAGAFVADMDARLASLGRDRSSVRALQSVMSVVAATERAALAKADELEAAVTDEATAAQGRQRTAGRRVSPQAPADRQTSSASA